MKKFLKIYCFVASGIIVTFITIVLIVLFLNAIDSSNKKTEINLSSNPSEIFGNSYSYNSNVVYVDEVSSFYYFGKEYSFKKKDVVYQDEKEIIYSDITKKIFYMSDNCIIYRKSKYEEADTSTGYKYTYRYYMITNNGDALLNIPGVFYLSDVKCFDNYLFFQNRVTKSYYIYDLSINSYEEITNEKYNDYIKSNYDVSVDNNIIKIHNNLTNLDKEISYDDIYNSKMVRYLVDDYLKINAEDNKSIELVVRGISVEVIDNKIILNLKIYGMNNLLLIYNFDDESINYYDWLSHNEYVDRINIFIIKKPNEDTVFTRYIKSYNN